MKLFPICFLFVAKFAFVLSSRNPSKRNWHHQGLGSPQVPPGVQVPPDQWFVQLLDHFKPTDDRTWKQRFRVSDAHYRPGGPAFLMIGGEGPANAAWMVAGTWMKYAEEYGAICFQLEHRFYGESHPTEDMSVKNLAYLTSEQALADIANFVTAMNSKYNLTEARWISFGGSYPGSLSAWLRLKYPHLIHGAVSTSGPLVANADFPEYLEVVSSALDRTNSGCKPAIVDGLARAARLTEHPMGWRLLEKTFKLCKPLNATNTKDVANLFETIIGMFEDVVQYNRDNREFEGITSNVTIDTVCDVIMSQKSSPLAGLAALNAFTLKATNQTCLSYSYDEMIQDFRNKEWNSSSEPGGRQWMYQTCTEFGWYQSSNQAGSPFTNFFPLSFFEQQCVDIFGPKFNVEALQSSIDRTNRMYGGKNIHVTNVVFVHGSFDPWHALGVTKDLSPDATAILIPETAHCTNMYPERDDDPPQLKQARVMVGKKIGEWLKKSGGSLRRKMVVTDNNVKSRKNDDFFTNIDFSKIRKFFKDLQG